MSQTTPAEPGFRIALPADWAEELGVQSEVTLERTPGGILIRPAAQPRKRLTWEQVFADKLVVNSGPGYDKDEVSGDDLLF